MLKTHHVPFESNIEGQMPQYFLSHLHNLKNIPRDRKYKFLVLLPSDNMIQVEFFTAFSKALVQFGNHVSKQYGISLHEVARSYAEGLKSKEYCISKLVKGVMDSIRSSINKVLIIRTTNLNKLSTWYRSIKWKIIGLCFTDAKISEWLRSSQLSFGTTDPYGIITFISQLRLASVYIDYFRYVSQTPKPAFIFRTERKLLSNLCGNCFQEIENHISTARNIFNQSYKILQSNVTIKKYKIQGNISTIHNIVDEISNTLINQKLIPLEEEDVSKFIASILSYDGYIHGGSLILTRNLLTIKGVTLESMLRALKRRNFIALSLKYGKKYIHEVSIIVSDKLREHIINEIDHIRKKYELHQLLSKKEINVKFRCLKELETIIDDVKLVSWHDKKYPDSHGYRLVFYIKSTHFIRKAMNIMKNLGMTAQTLKRSRIIKIASDKIYAAAIAMLIGKADLEDIVPNYKRQYMVWKYLANLKNYLAEIKESLLEEKLWDDNYEQRYKNIIQKIEKLLREVH